MKGSRWRLRQRWQPASMMGLTCAPESRICWLLRWASTLSDSTPVHPTPALPKGFLLHFPGCLLLLKRGHTWFGNQGSPARSRLTPRCKGDNPPPSPLSRRQFLSARAHFLDFHFLYLWLVNAIAPLWKWVGVPWSHNRPSISVTERLDRGS